MESHQWRLIVLEGRVWVLFVDYTLTRELLVIVGDLYCQYTWIVNLIVSDHELTIVVYFGCELVGAKAYF